MEQHESEEACTGFILCSIVLLV